MPDADEPRMSRDVPSRGYYKPDIPKAKEKGHRCERSLPEAAYGAALTYCYEDEDGKLWVTNEEYASQVNHCPYCGHTAKEGVTEK